METKSLSSISSPTQGAVGTSRGVTPNEHLNNTTAGLGASPTNPPEVIPPITVSTPFETRNLGGEVKPNGQVVINTFEDLLGMISTESGVEVKSLDDIVSKVISPLKELRVEVNKLPEMENRVNSLSEVITTMPDELKQMVYTWMNGGNYQEVMANHVVAKSIDFSKDFGDHNEIKLINHFTKGSFTPETFTALDPTVQESLRSVARTQYDTNKRQLQVKPDLAKTVETRRASFIESVDASIAELKRKFPDMSSQRVQEVRNTLLVGGHNKRIYTAEGTYKPTAAADVSMMLYGSEAIASQNATINEIMQAQLSRGASSAAERILNRSDKPNITTQRGTAIPSQEISDKVKKATAFLRNGGGGEQF